MMAMNLQDPTAQTWVFPAATATANESSSIYISGLYELVGFFWEAMEASTAKMFMEVTADAPSILDAAATFVPVWVAGGTRVTLTQVFTAAGYTAFSPDNVILGPIRVRLVAYQTNGSTGVDQDEQVVTPQFRSM
jgi:hypothetical protein